MYLKKGGCTSFLGSLGYIFSLLLLIGILHQDVASGSPLIKREDNEPGLGLYLFTSLLLSMFSAPSLPYSPHPYIQSISLLPRQRQRQYSPDSRAHLQRC